VTLRCDGLAGPGGRSIPEGSIRFDPGRVTVPARAAERVTCTVTVPEATRAGTYTGTIEAPGHAGVQLRVSLTVG